MATLISCATGNFTSSASWWTVDSTSLLDSEANSTALSTSYVTSSTFTPGAISVEGIAIKIASRAAGSPTNTITVALDQAGATVTGTETTMNVSDIDACSTGTSPATSTCEGGWYFFRFNLLGTPSPVTLLGGTAYSVKVKLSATSTAVSLYRDGTSNNWSRMLATSTTAAPASGDTLHVIGENLAAGSGNNFTITMDNTATTTFGAVAQTTGTFTVGKRGALTWGTAASTAYLLKIAGIVVIYSGGTWNQGTSGTRVPSTSSATLQFVVSTNVDSGFIARNGSVVNRYGNIVTTVKTLLTADLAAAGTTVTVASTSGWAQNDEIAIASTTDTRTQHEKRTISTVDSGTQVTISSGATNAHSGTSPIQGEVLHLTRNAKVIGTSTSLQAYVYYGNTAVVNDSYCEFTYLGSATTNKRGVVVACITGSYTATGCTYHTTGVSSSVGMYITGSTADNIAVTLCICYSLNSNGFEVSQATSGTSISFTSCYAMAATAGFALADSGVSMSGCIGSCCSAYGFSLTEAALYTGTISNIEAHTCSNNGVYANQQRRLTIDTLKVWRNGGSGLNIDFCTAMYISSITAFGNSGSNVSVNRANFVSIAGGAMNGDTTYSTAVGVDCANTNHTVRCESITFGQASGILTTHSTADIRVSTPTEVQCNNCVMASTTETTFTSAGSQTYTMYNIISSQKHDQTAGLHKRWQPQGRAVTDTVTYKTASPSEQLTPLSATIKFESSPKQFAIANGASATVTTYCYKSGSYNGAQPRLIVRANPAVGITSDTVLATASGGTGSWLTLSGTTATVTDDGVLEVYVDCDGTAGTVNVDDWSVT